MKQPRRPRRRALSCLLALVLAPVTVATVPTASAEEPGPRAERTRIAPAEPLLDGPARGRKALRQLGDDLPAAAARNDLRPARLRSLLRTDNTVWLDPSGSLYYVDPVHHEGDGSHESSATAEPVAAASQVAPLAETFALHSNPGASRTILLDFDGAYVSGSWWNEEDMPVLPGTHPAWDPAGDGPGFSDGERLKIQQIWAMVAEDYAPFDVDVTTADPGDAGMVRSSLSDTTYGSRVLITPSADALTAICGSGCGGVAYMGVFDLLGSAHQPAWVFPQALGDDPKNIAEAATHEAGHNLGLDHDRTATQGYYAGHGIWAPIMGVGYNRPLVQWSAGLYPGGTNQEDDLGILAGYLGHRPDEAPGSVDTPAPLPVDTAYVGTRSDVDAYLLGSCAAGAVVEVLPTAVAPNLDVRATLYDASGVQRAVAAPASGPVSRTTASGLGGALTIPADGDGWVVTVDGAGQGTWSTGGYDDYGSLGAYTVGAPGCNGQTAAGVPSAPSGVTTGSAQTDALTLSWSTPAAEGDGPVTSYVVSRSGSTASTTLPADARSHTFTGLTAGTSYQLSVRATNATGAGPTATVTATTSAPPAAAPSAPRNVTGSYDPVVDTLHAWWSEPTSPGTEPITGYAITVDGYSLDLLGPTSRGVRISSSAGFPEGTYVVGVAAVNAVGSSPVATVSITVTQPPPVAVPDAPAGPTAVHGAGSAQVSWAKPANGGSPITGYTVTSSPGGHTKIVTGADTTNTTITGLTNGTAYTFTVVARNAVGDSPASVPSDAVTPLPAATPPGKMKPPKVVVRGRKAVVRWTAARPNGSAVTRYLVDISRGRDKSLRPGARKAVFKLKPGRYRVRVAARNAVGTAPYSRWVRFRIR